MRDKQLVSIIKKFEIWDVYSPLDKKLKLINADDTPFIRWPNREPCFEANLYMLSGLKRSLSRRVRGGTLRTYAMNITFLIRFCYENQIKLTELTDNWFRLFINSLQSEKHLNGKRLRSNNQVLKIGKQCIDFLIFLKAAYNLEAFIGGESFNAIRVWEKSFKIKSSHSSKRITKSSLYHNSFPKPDSFRRRHPISDSAASAIKTVIQNQNDRGLVKRNAAIYQTYEQTGGRRTEGIWLRVNDVREALDSAYECPLIRLITLKRSNQDEERYVPVSRVYLENINNYVRTTRRRVIKRTIGHKKDHGIVFISHVTGLPLTPDTVSTYMNNWRRESGISEQAFIHLLRHAFITEKLKCIILEHELQNQDEFRKALLNTERFKLQLQQWTGHAHLPSLDTYIDLAFADLAGVRQTYDAVALKSSTELIKDKIQTLKLEIESGQVGIHILLNELINALNSFSQDIDQCTTTKA